MLTRFTALIGVAALQASVVAAAGPPNPAATAYDYALRCFVANVAIKDEAATKVAFDAVLKVGRSQGYANRKLNADLEQAPYREAKLVRDKAVLQQVLKDCRALGLAR